MAQGINIFNEKPLHAALKKWYAQPDDLLETEVDGFIIDIVRKDLLIEIQTRNFSALKRKLNVLLKQHHILLVYPIAQEKWIIKRSVDAVTPESHRKSPKRGNLNDVFIELVSIPHLLEHPNFSLEIVFIQEEEVRHHDPKRGWRRHGWVTEERRLSSVVSCQRFNTPADFAVAIPQTLPEPFTTADLARPLGRSRRFAQKVAYCLREMGLITAQGKRGNAILYTRTRLEEVACHSPSACRSTSKPA